MHFLLRKQPKPRLCNHQRQNRSLPFFDQLFAGCNHAQLRWHHHLLTVNHWPVPAFLHTRSFKVATVSAKAVIGFVAEPAAQSLVLVHLQTECRACTIGATQAPTAGGKQVLIDTKITPSDNVICGCARSRQSTKPLSLMMLKIINAPKLLTFNVKFFIY